jgi:RNA polymerase sigma factor (sigma-70 family)
MYSSQLYAVCLRYAIDKNDAKDILQEGFIKIFTHLHQFNNTGTIYGWMKQIMVNTALNFIKKNKKYKALEVEEYMDLQQEGFSVIEKINSKEIMNCFMELPNKYRIVMSMFIIEGYSHAEISKILEIEESTCRSKVFRGKILLQKLLNEKNNFTIEVKQLQRDGK